MKKQFMYFSFLVFILLLSPMVVHADYQAKFVADGKCTLNKNATGNCYYADTTFKTLVNKGFWLDTGDEVTVITSKNPVNAPTSGNGSECEGTYSYVKLIYKNNPYYGYACTANIKVANVTDEIKKELEEAGFPESYWDDLAILKEAHPTWKFIAIPTELDFQTAVDNMDVGSKSLYQSTSSNTQGYLSTKEENYNWDTDTFKVYDGKNWYAANNQTIAYYLDPRNFLSDSYIFQFEALNYLENVHTLETVENILGTSYISKFATDFFEAGVYYQVNPLHLATRSLVELGSGTEPNLAISGKSVTVDGKTYSGFYNFYNIGAYAGTNAAQLAVAYAGTAGSYGRPWNTEKKAIYGGAEFIEFGYVNRGQFNTYFEKWNTIYNYSKKNGISNPAPNYTHQYQQSVFAPSVEAENSYRARVKSGSEVMNEAYIFYIPVYKNMPASTSLPTQGNPNNRLKTINIDDKKIDGYSSSNFNYNITVPTETDKIKLTATTINSAATVSGTGTISLNEGENKVELKVKAQNGNMQTYTINITRTPTDVPIVYPTVSEIMKDTPYVLRNNYIHNFSISTKVTTLKEQITKISPTAVVTVSANNKEKTTGNIQTGDTITVISGEDKAIYTAVIYGDINGDNSISVLDLLKAQKHILGFSSLSGASKEAADINKDGQITVLDLLKIQKHILGYSAISQK